MTKAKILVVEDEEITAADIQERLIRFGYNVPAVAISGREAIKKAEEIRPDLILMDIVLKGEMDGIEAAEQIRSSFDIPIVYLTVHADKKTLKRANITEPFGFLTKPYHDNQLYAIVEMALFKKKSARTVQSKGKLFENQIAKLFRMIGYEMKQNVGILGHQIDIILTYIQPGSIITRTAIECKYVEKGNLKKNDVSKNITALVDLRNNKKVHNTIVITTNGFAKDVWDSARANDIQLLTLEEFQLHTLRRHFK